MASSSSCFFTTWKMFSIGFKSGDLAGILCRVHSILSRANKATLLFWQGQLSMTNMRCLPLLGPALVKHKFRFSFTKPAKKGPSIFSYAFLKITPLPYATATMRCNRLPPGKSLLPLLVISSPSPRFLHTRDFGCRAVLSGLYL